MTQGIVQRRYIIWGGVLPILCQQGLWNQISGGSRLRFQIHTLIFTLFKMSIGTSNFLCLLSIPNKEYFFHNDFVAAVSDERNRSGRHNLEFLGKRLKEEALIKYLLIQVNTLRLKDELKGFF